MEFRPFLLRSDGSESIQGAFRVHSKFPPIGNDVRWDGDSRQIFGALRLMIWIHQLVSLLVHVPMLGLGMRELTRPVCKLERLSLWNASCVGAVTKCISETFPGVYASKVRRVKLSYTPLDDSQVIYSKQFNSTV